MKKQTFRSFYENLTLFELFHLSSVSEVSEGKSFLNTSLLKLVSLAGNLRFRTLLTKIDYKGVGETFPKELISWPFVLGDMVEQFVEQMSKVERELPIFSKNMALSGLVCLSFFWSFFLGICAKC